MGNLFEGLEKLGLKDLRNVKLFEEEEKKKTEKENVAAVVKEITEEDMLFDKTSKCPICDRDFTNKTVRTGKPKLLSSDSDLRPIYQGIDPLKYDAITCPFCGYSALSRYFSVNPTTGQLRLIKENLANFSGLAEPEVKYSYDDAITRHRLALVCTVIKKGKPSEKAYTCLKLAWLFRGKREALIKNNKATKEDIEILNNSEKEFLTNAYNGFIEAFSKENFPMAGMDEVTVTFLTANLADEIGKYDDALRLVERIIISRDANSNIKGKANELKEKIRERKEKK
ncbi:MAG: DUF2225 domain-containing protein [Lachnospiraceae bacterium]|nr:DUF2225 domain-containing protein [Lachnospiraceae bacterium]